MITLLTIFIAVAGAGFAFWFYNKRQMNTLSEQLEDKNIVINALRNHVDSDSMTTREDEVQIKFTRKDPNDGWRGDSKKVNLTPTVDEALGKKKKYKNKPKKSSEQNQPKQQPQQNTEKKNRPKPRKPKTQQ